jgi:hypothetical protein
VSGCELKSRGNVRVWVFGCRSGTVTDKFYELETEQ